MSRQGSHLHEEREGAALQANRAIRPREPDSHTSTFTTHAATSTAMNKRRRTPTIRLLAVMADFERVPEIVHISQNNNGVCLLRQPRVYWAASLETYPFFAHIQTEGGGAM